MQIFLREWGANRMSKIELKNIDKYYGKNHVLKNLDLTIEDGEFMTLLGPSGCGKTTTLRVVAGLEKPQNGTIHIDETEIVNAQEMHFEPPIKRSLNLVFQSYALWPHMTVFENVAFGLAIKKKPKSEINKKVNSALERMQIEKYGQRYPSELSGGQQQRVAIARAIVSEPKLLLLDEPLSNLDAKLRVDMRSELKRLHKELGTTVIYVTHDQVEALTMSTRIAIFFEGILAQVDTPQNVYNNPSDLRVADFIGNPRINLLKCKAKKVEEQLQVTSDFGRMLFPQKDLVHSKIQSSEFDCVLGIRPEQVVISTTRTNDTQVEAKVYTSMPAGSENLIQINIGESNLLAKEIGVTNYASDQTVYLSIDPDKTNVFDAESKMLIKYSAN